MKKVGDSIAYVGRDKFYHCYEFKTTITAVINALEDAECPKPILKELWEWASQPYPEPDDLRALVKYQYQNKPF